MATHGALSHIVDTALATSLPERPGVVVQNDTASSAATEAQGAQMSAAEAGMYWVGLEEAVLSTQARPQRSRLNEEAP